MLFFFFECLNPTCVNVFNGIVNPPAVLEIGFVFLYNILDDLPQFQVWEFIYCSMRYPYEHGEDDLPFNCASSSFLFSMVSNHL